MKLLSVFVAALAVASISATPILDGLLKTVTKPVNGLVETVVDVVGDVLKNVLCTLDEVTTTVCNVTGSLTKIVGSLSKALNKLNIVIACALETIREVVVSLNLILGDLICDALGAVECALNNLVKKVSEISHCTTEKLDVLISELYTLVEVLLDTIVCLTEAVINVIVCELTEIITKNILSALLETVLTIAAEVLCSVTGLIDEKCGLSDIIINLPNALQEIICTVTELVDCLLDDVLVKVLQETLEILHDLQSSCKEIC